MNRLLEQRNTIQTLRSWAQGRGFVLLDARQRRPEVWGEIDSESGKFEWRLKIKREPSFRLGLEWKSYFPRFDARLKDGVYINPLTGEVGGRLVGSHIPLESARV